MLIRNPLSFEVHGEGVIFISLVLFSFILLPMVHYCLFVQIADVKKNIETAQGKSVYPAEQQLLIHQGKILRDDTTLQDNQVLEDSFLVIMLTKVHLLCPKIRFCLHNCFS